MKKSLKIAALFMGIAAIASCGKDKDDVINIEETYDMVYMLGANALDEEGNSHWDASDPVAMTPTGVKNEFEVELDMIRTAENKLIKFVLSNDKPWDQAKFLVPALADMDGTNPYAFLKEGVNKLELSAETAPGVLRDHFFGMAKGTSGRYKLVVNPAAKTLTATKLSTLEEPEIMEWEEGMLYLVGDLNGWAIAQPTPMVKNGAIFTYEGNVKNGTFKIATKFNWDDPFWRPTTADVKISRTGITSTATDLYEKDDTVPASKDDYKWNVDETGIYRLTLDTTAKTFNATWISAE